jgi:hypothetical protein
MSATARQRLLLDALLLPPKQAENAWRNWRASTDLKDLDSGSFHLLPALAGRMPMWLANDPQQAILKGICRQAWSQNQVQRKLLADALQILADAGIERIAATGPVLWALDWPEGAIRPIRVLDLLIEPKVVRLAFEALSRAGWQAPDGIPDSGRKQFCFAGGRLLESVSGGKLRLHWRALPNTDFSLRRPRFPPLEAKLPDLGATCYRIPLEYSLVTALGGNHEDGLEWRFDALILCRQPGLRWERVAALLRWRAAQRKRLEELRRDWGAEIPAAVTKPVWTSSVEQPLAAVLRVYRRRLQSVNQPLRPPAAPPPVG